MGLGSFIKDNAGLIGTGVGAFFGGPAGAAIGGGIGSLVSAGGKSGDPTLTPKAQPLAEVQPHLGSFFGGGADLFRTQAPLAKDAGDILFRSGLSAAQGELSKPTQRAISLSLQPLQERLTEQVLPGISSAATLAGATGGARERLLEEAAIQDFIRTGGDIATNVGFQEYLAAPQMISRALGVQQLPLMSFGDVLSTSPAGTAVEIGPSPRAAALQGALGGGLSGYQLGGGYGAGLGAALGGLTGGLR